MPRNINETAKNTVKTVLRKNPELQIFTIFTVFSQRFLACFCAGKFFSLKKIAAFQVSENDAAAIPFYQQDKAATRIMAKKYTSILMGLAKVNDCGKGIRFYGDYLAEDKAIVFDFAAARVTVKSSLKASATTVAAENDSEKPKKEEPKKEEAEDIDDDKVW